MIVPMLASELALNGAGRPDTRLWLFPPGMNDIAVGQLLSAERNVQDTYRYDLPKFLEIMGPRKPAR